MHLNDSELRNLIDNLQILQLKKATLTDQLYLIHCEFATGTARPYILVSVYK